MYTEQEIRDRLTRAGYRSTDIDVIVDWFPFHGPMSFGGMNCDECDGWDGLDHRCNCGNRRVYWVVEGKYAYGEAH